MKTVFVLNGSNLNLLGIHSPLSGELRTLDEVQALCAATCETLGLSLDFRQTNHEGQLVEAIHEAAHAQTAGECIGVVLNAGAYAHTSIALHDAIKGTGARVIELNIANVFTREPFRHHSYVALVARAVVGGFGIRGYALAIAGLAAIDGEKQSTPAVRAEADPVLSDLRQLGHLLRT